MTGGSLTTTVVAVCACLLAQALVGCAADPAPKPRAGAAAVVLEVVAAPKKGAKANRFTRVPVYDAAPQPAAPSGQFELVDYSALGDVIVWLEPAGAGDVTTAGETASGARPIVPPPSPLAVDVAADAHPDDVRGATVGQEIVFRNRGAGAVSLYSVSDDNDFDLPA